MQPQLERVRQELTAASERVRGFQALLSNDEWQRKPRAAGWSAIECVQHLNLTSQSYLERLTNGIADAPLLTAPKRFHLDLPGWLLVRMMNSRSKVSKSKTLPGFVPASNLDVEATIATFEGLQDHLIGLVEKCENKAIDKVKIESSFNERVHYHIFSAFRIVAAHERRHLDQAERAARGEI